MIVLSVFVFGAMVGSFLNVCIYRLPLHLSIAFPRSYCPACQTPIRAYDNIPILSYFILRGRCRVCGMEISPRYPLIETLTGVTAVAAVLHFGWRPELPVAFAFLCALIVVAFIDLDHQIIPDPVSLPGIVVGFLAAIVTGDPGWKASLIGILMGGGILWAVAEGYHRLTGREGMGGGDIKLLAMIGAFLGWRAVPVTLLLSSLAGTAVGLSLILFQRQDSRTPIPFGPFLALGAVCALFYGNALIDWYLTLSQPALGG
jgi:leader peptidase (prepilin peptidase) / N-methyltransferase